MHLWDFLSHMDANEIHSHRDPPPEKTIAGRFLTSTEPRPYLTPSSTLPVPCVKTVAEKQQIPIISLCSPWRVTCGDDFQMLSWEKPTDASCGTPNLPAWALGSCCLLCGKADGMASLLAPKPGLSPWQIFRSHFSLTARSLFKVPGEALHPVLPPNPCCSD